MGLWHDVHDDDSFTPEADPVLRKLTRKAGAAIVQDIMLGTYWANISGKSPLKHPGVHHMYKKELHENMEELLRSKMSYRELEEFMVTLGYEAGDIRCCFRKATGLDPVKLEYMRGEDVKNTPANIPWYNLGWGWAKKGQGSYFVMPYANNVYTIFQQSDDMTRKEINSFLCHEEAIEHLGGLVKRVHRYDVSAMDAVEDAMRSPVKEPEKREYRVLANYLDDLARRGELDETHAKILIRDAAIGGSLTEDEAILMMELHVHADATYGEGSSMPNPQHTADTPDMGHAQELVDAQQSRRVIDEVEKNKTPNDFFHRALPDRIDAEAPDHVKGVLGYIANRETDLGEFKVSLYSMEYKRQDSARTLVEVDPQTGRPSGPPVATISVVLEIQDTTLQEDMSRKFALAVFFVNADGDVTTSDSVKGEDDIVYGFTDEGLQQYFAKDRASKAI